LTSLSNTFTTASKSTLCDVPWAKKQLSTLIIQKTHEVGEGQKVCGLVKKWLRLNHYISTPLRLRITLVKQFSQDEGLGQ
jgi:hypothetical protein